MMHHHNSFLENPRTSVCFALLVTSVIFLAAIPLRSQDKKQTKSADDDDVIRVTSNLVSLDAIVKDKKGKAVLDLKPEDFSVTENGVPQKIQFFDSTLSTNETAQTLKADDSSQPTKANDSPQPTARPRNGLPRNIIALVLDGQSTELANLKHVREGIV